MNRYGEGRNLYEAQLGSHQESLREWRADTDQTKEANKALEQTAEMKTDLNALRGIGEEGVVRLGRTYAEKYGGQLYKFKTNYKSDFFKSRITLAECKYYGKMF